jgi:hypothetical protein
VASLRNLLAAALDANRELARLKAELRAENERLRAENAEQAAELGTLHADLASAGSPRRPGAHHHPATYTLRACHVRCSQGSKPGLASCSQAVAAAGGGRWLLMGVRGHLGDMRP